MTKLFLATILHFHLFLIPVFHPHLLDTNDGFITAIDTPSWGYITRTDALEQPDGAVIQGEIKW
jgi:hypothetical protein